MGLLYALCPSWEFVLWFCERFSSCVAVLPFPPIIHVRAELLITQNAYKPVIHFDSHTYCLCKVYIKWCYTQASTTRGVLRAFVAITHMYVCKYTYIVLYRRIIHTICAQVCRVHRVILAARTSDIRFAENTAGNRGNFAHSNKP